MFPCGSSADEINTIYDKSNKYILSRACKKSVIKLKANMQALKTLSEYYKTANANCIVSMFLKHAKCSEDIFPRGSSADEVKNIYNKMEDYIMSGTYKKDEYSGRIRLRALRTLKKHRATAYFNLEVLILLKRAKCSEDIVKRDFDAIKLHEVYYNQKEYILSFVSLTGLDLVTKALDTLDGYYNTARAELDLPPID